MENQLEMYDKVFEYIDADRTAEAMDIAQRLVDANMSNSAAWYAYAHAKKAWGDTALAIKGFEQAIAITPDFTDAYLELADIYGDNKQFEKSIEYAEKVLSYSPTNNVAMELIVLAIGDTEGTDAAIEKCKYFLEIADEILSLQNILGMLYVAKAEEFIVDICDDSGNPEDSYPAFISLDDIKEARSLCETAKSLLTLDSFNEYVEEAEKTLKLCDLDENTKTRVSSIIFLIIHALISTVIYILLSPFGIGIFGLLLAPWVTFKANYFPDYMINFADYTGSNDPLAYKNTRLAKIADFAEKQGIINKNGSIFWAHIWVIRSRFSFYKRFFKKIKSKKQALK